MDSPFATVQEDLPISQLNRYMTKEMPAVIVRDRSGGAHIVSQYDLIQAI
jgi:predicted transcriptional regulator